MADSYHLLVSLLETLSDSIAGYEHVGDHAHGFRLYAFCEQQALSRKKIFGEFIEHMKVHNWTTDIHGTILGSAHRLFVDLRAAIAQDEHAVIAELHRGETFLLKKIETALAEGRFDLPLQKQLERIAEEVGGALEELGRQLQRGLHGGGARPVNG